MEPQTEELSCKIIIVGDSGVGKTSIMNRFCKGSYQTESLSIAVDFCTKRLKIYNAQEVNMMIWDTAGQEKYYSITKLYFRNAMAAVFVYDVTCQKTLCNLDKWLNIVKEKAPPDVIKVLVGHKCDDEKFKQITTSEGKAVADHFGMSFFEASSKENINVDSIFCFIATMFLVNNMDKTLPLQRPSDVMMLTNEDNNHRQHESNCFLNYFYDWFKF